ncbi:septal ring lytic transglycosylase RlpA family protein [Xylophilus sp. Kf1]|nr:septal ring lytic transglycosylase RlpA family protein [Xylophilus sp. Kf1]
MTAATARWAARVAALALVGLAIEGCAVEPQSPAAAPAASASAPAPPPPLVVLKRLAETPTAGAQSRVATVTADNAIDPDEERAAPGEEFERGGASWYGSRFQGRRTASGERFDMADLTAAHRTLPFGTLICVRNLTNNAVVMVRVNDRGPASRRRVIDISQAAAEGLAMVGMGVQTVALQRPVSGQSRCE